MALSFSQLLKSAADFSVIKWCIQVGTVADQTFAGGPKPTDYNSTLDIGGDDYSLNRCLNTILNNYNCSEAYFGIAGFSNNEYY